MCILKYNWKNLRVCVCAWMEYLQRHRKVCSKVVFSVNDWALYTNKQIVITISMMRRNYYSEAGSDDQLLVNYSIHSFTNQLGIKAEPIPKILALRKYIEFPFMGSFNISFYLPPVQGAGVVIQTHVKAPPSIPSNSTQRAPCSPTKTPS